MPNDPKDPYTQNITQPPVPPGDASTPQRPPQYSREELLAMPESEFNAYADQARSWKAHTEAMHAQALEHEANAIKAQVAAERAAKELKLKQLHFNRMTGTGILAGTAGLLGGIYGGKKLWDHYHPQQPQQPPPPMPPVPEAQDTETFAMPQTQDTEYGFEQPKQADDLGMPPRLNNALTSLNSLVEPSHPYVIPGTAPSSLAQYDLDFMPDIQARDALVQQLLQENQMEQPKQANWFGDIGRRIAGRSPEYIQQRNAINTLGKLKTEQDALTALAKKHGVPHGHPELPAGVEGVTPEPEQSFLQKNKWPLIGAGGLGAGYLAYQNGLIGGQQGAPYLKMSHDEKHAGMLSNIANKVKGAVKGTAKEEAKVIPFAKPVPKQSPQPPKPQQMAEKVTDKKPLTLAQRNKGKTTEEIMAEAKARKEHSGGAPFAKVVPKTAAEQGYDAMLVRLGILKEAAPAPPAAAIASSFKKGPNLLKKGPPPVPKKDPKADYDYVQRTMGFGKNSSAFDAGYDDIMFKLAAIPAAAAKQTVNKLRSFVSARKPTPSPESMTRGFQSSGRPGGSLPKVTPETAAAVAPFRAAPAAAPAKAAPAPSFGGGIVPKAAPATPAGADTRSALGRIESQLAGKPVPKAAPAAAAAPSMDLGKAPPLLQGGRQGLLPKSEPVKAPEPTTPKAPAAPKPQAQPAAGAETKPAAKPAPAAAPAAAPGAATPAAAEVPAQPGAFRQGFDKMREGFGQMPAGARYGILGGGAGLAGLGAGAAIGSAMQPDVNVIH